MARDYPASYAYNAIKEFTVGPITQRNRNLLLWRDPSVDGIKTGHTSEAGYCLMASAKRSDMRLIAVMLDDTSENQRAVDAQALLNWGFRFFEGHVLYAPGKPVTTQRVWKGQANTVALGVATPLVVTVPRGQYAKLKASMELPKALVAPLKAGQVVGTVKLSLDGKPLTSQPLVVTQAVPEAGFFGRLWDSLLMWWHDL
jgi:D-alanyl-D-alanine carboxypeptidase (penicillin-binding protein 5/6)